MTPIRALRSLALSLFLTLSGLVALAASTSAFAGGSGGGGSEGGNGGGLMILPNGEVVLADAFYRRDGQCSTCGTLSTDLWQTLQAAGQLLVHFGARMDSREQSQFISDFVLNQTVEYRFLEPQVFLAKKCLFAADDEFLIPENAQKVPGACTQGWTTSFRADLFRKMRLREQAKTIIHERLHHAADGQPHEYISDITDAVDALLKLARQGNQPTYRLNADEVRVIELLPKRLAQVGMSRWTQNEHWNFTNRMSIWPNGGALVQRGMKLDETAYADVWSVLEGNVALGASTRIENSRLKGSIELKPGVRVSDSKLEGNITIRSDGLILKSEIQLSAHLGGVPDKAPLAHLEIEPSVHIEGSKFKVGISDAQSVELRIFSSAYLQNASFDIGSLRSVPLRAYLAGTVLNSDITSGDSAFLNLGPGSRMVNSRITNFERIILAKDSLVSNTELHCTLFCNLSVGQNTRVMNLPITSILHSVHKSPWKHSAGLILSSGRTFDASSRNVCNGGDVIHLREPNTWEAASLEELAKKCGEEHFY